MFGTSGIRGPIGETVTADLALTVGRALVADGSDQRDVTDTRTRMLVISSDRER